jgi:hypothetical protein
VLANFVNLVLERTDTLPDAPAVELESRLARSACAYATTLPRKHSTSTDEAWQQELILGELDLDAALVAACVLGKDIEDKRRSIDDSPT